MRLINADALIQSLEKKHEHWHELVPEENKEIEFAHSYALNVIRNAPTADAKPTVIQSKTLFPTKDFMEWAKRIKEVNPNAVVIPCDAEVASAEAVQIPIKLEKRYPESKDEDITDAFMRGYLAGRSSAEAVQGEWIDIDNYYRLATCSHCRKVTMFEKCGECTKPYNFCPNCGAKMKGADDETD